MYCVSQSEMLIIFLFEKTSALSMPPLFFAAPISNAWKWYTPKIGKNSRQENPNSQTPWPRVVYEETKGNITQGLLCRGDWPSYALIWDLYSDLDFCFDLYLQSELGSIKVPIDIYAGSSALFYVIILYSLAANDHKVVIKIPYPAFLSIFYNVQFPN